jgi:hypothetical protein
MACVQETHGRHEADRAPLFPEPVGKGLHFGYGGNDLHRMKDKKKTQEVLLNRRVAEGAEYALISPGYFSASPRLRGKF